MRSFSFAAPHYAVYISADRSPCRFTRTDLSPSGPNGQIASDQRKLSRKVCIGLRTTGGRFSSGFGAGTKLSPCERRNRTDRPRFSNPPRSVPTGVCHGWRGPEVCRMGLTTTDSRPACWAEVGFLTPWGGRPDCGAERTHWVLGKKQGGYHACGQTPDRVEFQPVRHGCAGGRSRRSPLRPAPTGIPDATCPFFAR